LGHLSAGFTRTTRSDPNAKGWRRRSGTKDFSKRGLFGLPQQHRLALEMALHEEAERRAIQGELDGLERAWREAEEIAGIADSMFLPESVDEAMDRMRRDVDRERAREEAEGK
jgi:hypothetical protein